MRIRPEHEYLFQAAGATRWLKRSRLPRANALFPLSFSTKPERTSEYFAYSTDKRMLRAAEILADRCTREFPATHDSAGFAGENGVPGDFYNLRNVSGLGMDPLPIPVSNNAALIEANGLAADIRPKDVPWLKELVRLFFGHAVPASLHIRKQASSGFPYFTSDIQYKKLSVMKIVHNVDHFLDLSTSNRPADLKEAQNVYHSFIIASINERQQPNAISLKDGVWSSKPRTAPTEQEAREGSYSGSTVADMVAKDEHGNVIEGHFNMRRRDVFGYSGPPNYFLTSVVACCREIYLNRFEFTYKTRDRLDKKRKVSRFKHVLGSDVKTMDKMIPEWFTKFVINELSYYLDDRVVELIRRMMQAPYVVPPPYRETSESYDPVFGGDPADPKSFKQHVGLPSGVAINPDWGKLWMTFVYAVLYRDVGALFDPAELEAFLQGRHPDHGLLDMSDDATFMTNVMAVAARLAEAKSPYVVLEPEKPVIYLGDVFTKVNGEVDAFPNPVTYLVNVIAREDSIDRMDPVQYAEGVLARHHTYSASPIFRDLNAIFEEVMRDSIGVSPIVMARGLARMQQFTDVDAMVKMDPNVIYYKVDPKDVSPDVLNEIVATIPAEDIWPHIKHLFKNQTRT